MWMWVAPPFCALLASTAPEMGESHLRLLSDASSFCRDESRFAFRPQAEDEPEVPARENPARQWDALAADPFAGAFTHLAFAFVFGSLVRS